MASFRLTPSAIDDIDAIWNYIVRDNLDAADAVEDAIRNACKVLARSPLHGHVRPALTSLPVRFWTVPRYPNYVIVYRPDSNPVQILRVLHGRRNLKKLLREL